MQCQNNMKVSEYETTQLVRQDAMDLSHTMTSKVDKPLMRCDMQCESLPSQCRVLCIAKFR